MKSCELCKSAAKIYCDSDQANLCWTCDNKVHSANFLVARHVRNLLCRVCHDPTPWTATGQTLGPSAVSFCEKCVASGTVDVRTVDNNNHVKENSLCDDDDDDYDADEESDNEINVDDDEGDNQVVPLPLSYTPPPPASSSSCGDYCVDDNVLLKRKRENVVDLCSEDDCLSVGKSHRLAESCEVIEGNKGTLYNFLPLSSEGMGENKDKDKDKDKNKNKVVGVCKGTRVVGIDLNSLDC